MDRVLAKNQQGLCTDFETEVFLLFQDKNLGILTSLRIGHDNSGEYVFLPNNYKVLYSYLFDSNIHFGCSSRQNLFELHNRPVYKIQLNRKQQIQDSCCIQFVFLPVKVKDLYCSILVVHKKMARLLFQGFQLYFAKKFNA